MQALIDNSIAYSESLYIYLSCHELKFLQYTMKNIFQLLWTSKYTLIKQSNFYSWFSHEDNIEILLNIFNDVMRRSGEHRLITN